MRRLLPTIVTLIALTSAVVAPAATRPAAEHASHAAHVAAETPVGPHESDHAGHLPETAPHDEPVPDEPVDMSGEHGLGGDAGAHDGHAAATAEPGPASDDRALVVGGFVAANALVLVAAAVVRRRDGVRRGGRGAR